MLYVCISFSAHISHSFHNYSFTEIKVSYREMLMLKLLPPELHQLMSVES